MIKFKEEVEHQKKLGYGENAATLNAVVECLNRNGCMPFNSEASIDTLQVTQTTKQTIKEMFKRAGEGQKIKRTK